MLKVPLVPARTKRSLSKRVGVACADVALCAKTLARIRNADISSVVDLDPETLARTASQFDLVLFFTDGFRTEPLLSALRSLEPLRERPFVILVWDRTPVSWRAPMDRTLVATLAAWDRNGLDWIRSSEPVLEPSTSELPFTD